MKRSNLDIYAYTDFRAFIQDRLAELKELDRKYSLRFLSNKLGLSSKSHLKMVADGKHNISEPLARKLATALGLDNGEIDFFLTLVTYGQAKDGEQRAAALEKLRSAKRFLQLHQVDLDQLDYYSDPVTLTLRELVELPDFEESSAWIGRRLPVKATAAGIRKAIEKLLRLGLLERDGDGRLRQAQTHIHSGHGFNSVALGTLYRESFQRAADSLAIPGTERYLGTILGAISKDSYDKIVRYYDEFIDKVRNVIDQDQQPEQVYQLVMGLYPLSRSDASSKEPGRPKRGGKS